MTEASSMTRRDVLKASTAPFVGALGSGLSFAGDTPPNIVYIMADDLGYADLSCYGRRDYKTPNIDGIAAGGMKFTQAYANSAVCSATRTALITGRYQYRIPVGLDEPIGMRDIGLPPEHPTLPSLLKKAGYETMLIGKWHLGNMPNYGPRKAGTTISGAFMAAASITSRIRAIRQKMPPANSGMTITEFSRLDI